MIAAAGLGIREGLNGLDYFMVGLYMALMILVGWRFSGQQKSAEHYFVGGRKMPWFVTGISVFATLMSTISYLAMPGEMIKKGIGILAGELNLPLSFLFVSFLIMPFYRRVPVTTAYEYLEKRFNVLVRCMGGVLFLLIRLGWMSLVVYTAAMAITAMTGMNIYFTIACVGLVTIIYTVMGGIQAVIWTDFAQFLILFGGVIFTIGYVVFKTSTGPVTWLSDAAKVGHTQVSFASLDPTVRISLLGIFVHNFFWQICTHGSDQVAVQRYLSVPSLGAARRSLGICMLCDITVAFLLATCGIALFSFYTNQPDLVAATFGGGSLMDQADQVFPKFIARQLPAGAAGLVVAALFAAAMSSLSSGIHSVATVITVDFYRRLLAGRVAVAGDAQWELKMGRWITLICGLLVSGAACLIVTGGEKLGVNIVEMANRINSFVVGPLAGLFFAGIFNRRCSATGALVGVLFGLVWGLFVTFSDTFLPGTNRVSFIHIIWSSSVVTFLMAGAVSLVRPERREAEVAPFVLGSGQVETA